MPGFLLEQVDLGHRHTRRDRHFFDDVQQTPLQRIGRIRRHPNATERACHHASPAIQHRRLVQTRQADDADNAQRRHDDDTGMPAQPLPRRQREPLRSRLQRSPIR